MTQHATCNMLLWPNGSSCLHAQRRFGSGSPVSPDHAGALHLLYRPAVEPQTDCMYEKPVQGQAAHRYDGPRHAVPCGRHTWHAARFGTPTNSLGPLETKRGRVVSEANDVAEAKSLRRRNESSVIDECAVPAASLPILA